MDYLLRYNFVITRKPHTCFGCGRVFPANTKMVSAACIDDGKAFSYYLCDTCDTIASELQGGEFDFGELREEALLMEKEG